MAVLFLGNSDEEIFGEMMIEYHKLFANKDNKYPSSIPDMMDVMWQQPMKQKSVSLPPKKVEPPAKEEAAQSFAQGDDAERACYCCGEPGCFPSKSKCQKKGQAKEDWHKPEYYKEIQHTQTISIIETDVETDEEHCFSGAQAA